MAATEIAPERALPEKLPEGMSSDGIFLDPAVKAQRQAVSQVHGLLAFFGKGSFGGNGINAFIPVSGAFLRLLDPEILL